MPAGGLPHPRAIGYIRAVLTRRSGAPSRFLLYRAPEHWVPRVDLFVFNVLLGFLPLLAAVFGFGSCGRDAAKALLDPRDPLHVLARPLPPQDGSAVHVRARVQGGDACLVTHEHMNNGWQEDWSGTAEDGASLVVERADGAPAPAAGTTLTIAWKAARWEPRLKVHATPREELWRAYFPVDGLRGSSEIPRYGRVLEGCLHPGDPVFVDLPAAEGSPPVLTPGDGTPRLRLAQLRASRVGEVSLLGLTVIVVVTYLWRVLGARPFTATILQRLGQPLIATVDLRGAVFAALSPLLLLGALWTFGRFGGDGAVDVERQPWACAYGACAAAIIVAVRIGDRLAALRSMARMVRAGACPPLDRAREGEALCFDAAVAAGAPVSAGLLTGRPRAHWLVSVTRIFKLGANSGSAPAPSHAGPLLLPLAGGALLDLTHVSPDLRAARRLVRPRALRRGAFAAIVGAAPPAKTSYLLEERFLEPGEPVLVMGRVVRFGTIPERAGQVPVIGGTASEPVVVHAGSRRSLLRGLAVERGYLAAALPVCVAVALGIAALAAWAISA